MTGGKPTGILQYLEKTIGDFVKKILILAYEKAQLESVNTNKINVEASNM